MYVQPERVKIHATHRLTGLSTPRSPRRGSLMKNLKYAFLTIAVWSFSVPALAQSPFDGAYLGLNLGHESVTAKTETIGTGTIAGSVTNDEFGASGLTGGVFAGYGHTFDSLYLGAEAEGSIGNADYNYKDNLGTTIKARQKDSYGASIRIGFLPVENTLLYSRLGIIRGKFSTKDNITDGSTYTVDVNESAYKTGAQLGLGAETALQDNIHVRLDWTYDDYQDWNLHASIPGTGVNQKISPNSNIFRVGLSYNFN